MKNTPECSTPIGLILMITLSFFFGFFVVSPIISFLGE